jgi:hypothetical protein
MFTELPGMRLKNDPSRRVRSELVYWRVHPSRSQNVLSDHSNRSLRDGFFIGLIPGRKLPGYHHIVPSGRKPLDTLPAKIDSESRATDEHFGQPLRVGDHGIMTGR